MGEGELCERFSPVWLHGILWVSQSIKLTQVVSDDIYWVSLIDWKTLPYAIPYLKARM